MLQTGLYYPYVHLRDESWAKAAALYWRNLARVVPPGFPVRDRDAIKELNDAGFLRTTDPQPAAEAVAPAFVSAIRENTDALRARFAVGERRFTERWQSAPALSATARTLTGLYPEEVPDALQEALREAGLARRSARGYVGDRLVWWLAVDPAVAWAYKCAITEELARRTAFAPVTDQLNAFTATGEWSSERVADTLLDRAEPRIGREAAQSRLALMAVQCVLPADLRNVPTEKILRLRTQYADEFTAFAAAIEAAAADIANATREVTDRAAFELHLQGAFERSIAQPLASLRKAMNGLKLNTIVTALTIKPEVTVSGTGLAWLAGGPATAVSTGIAFAALATRQAVARERDALVTSSPAGYLLKVERDVKPATLLRRAGRSIARTTGVGI
ncbi:DUF6236 family protein [Kitasatospora sp. NPDC097605]|uniref:DUF6236 family protein n=1 Tax=Kitasatospora sp. NPDC097605 TaxID=3157226 RepID=UPI00331C47AB